MNIKLNYRYCRRGSVYGNREASTLLLYQTVVSSITMRDECNCVMWYRNKNSKHQIKRRESLHGYVKISKKTWNVRIRTIVPQLFQLWMILDPKKNV